MQARTIIYHHRTQATGAEGVHIRGIQHAMEADGFTVQDISLAKGGGSVGKAASEKTGARSVLFSFFSLIAKHLPNFLFKLVEVFYPAWAFLSGWKAWKKNDQGRSVGYFYDRYAYFSFGIPLLCRLVRAPLVLEVNVTCLDYDIRKIMFKPYAKIVERFCFRNATVVVVVSSYLKEKIMETYGIEEDRIVVTPNAVIPESFHLAQSPPASLSGVREFARNRRIVGFVGVFVPWHGVDFLLDVFKSVCRDDTGEGRPGLLLIGDGPVRDAVEKKAKDLSMDGDVFISGMVPHEYIKYCIDLFDIAVMPDSNPFGSPMKIFEYMVMEKAVLAPAYGPIEEVLTDGVNGKVFQPRDHEDCVQRLSLLMSDPGLRQSLGRRAQNDVLKKHTWYHNLGRITTGLERHL